MSTYRIALKNFRSVKKADIQLNGITVLTGPNNSGKSTISKFFFHFMGSIMNFEGRVNKEFAGFIKSVDTVIQEILEDIVINALMENNFSNQVQDAITSLRSILLKNIKAKNGNILSIKIDDWSNKDIDTLKENMKDIFNYVKQKNKFKSLHRLLSIFSREQSKMLIDYIDKEDTDNIVTLLVSLIKEESKKRKKCIETRLEKEILPLVNAELHHRGNGYTYDIKKDTISLKKNGTSEDIMLKDVEKCTISYVQATYSLKEHKGLTGYHVPETDTFIPDDEIYELWRHKGFLDGKIKEGNIELQYMQNGRSYSLEDCASGVNSVAQLILLYKEGKIRKNDIVILDEPEVHLHPAWIVEYARLIVMLRKKTEALFLIATHSPPMVDALQELSKVEGIDDEVHFYVSEQTKDDFYKYEFKDHGQSIEGIYGSFNTFMERIAKYYNEEE